MRIKLFTSLCILAGCLAARQANAAIAFPDPPGGWTYQFGCDTLNTTNPTAGASLAGCNNCGVSFDGTWHFTGGGSDQWGGDGLCPPFSTNTVYGSANSQGGWSVFSEADPVYGGPMTFLRMQDTGDPRLSGFKDQPSNRKLMMGRQMDLLDSATATQLADGFTMCFRARIPTFNHTTNCIDPLFPASAALGAPGPKPYPPGGDGYVTFNGGKGNFMVHDGEASSFNRGASIAFSLTQTNDNAGSPTPITGFAGLTMNENAGSTINNNVDFGQGTGTNLFPADPTLWHEFWIVIKADPSGIATHEAYIFMDTNSNVKVFHVTAGESGGQADFGNASTYICIASPSTGQSCALDIDFIAYKLGEFYPGGAINILPPNIGKNSPAFGFTFYPAASGLSMEVLTFGTNSIPASGSAQLKLNGTDVSASLVASGTAQDRTFTYSGLTANTYYTGFMIVADQAGRSVTNNFAFDTFTEGAPNIIVESEDYNFSSGQFIDNPLPGAYAGKVGTYLTDFEDSSLATTGDYRTSDAVDITASFDNPRPKFTGSGYTDYDIGSIVQAEWVNYTRTVAAGSYHVFLRASAVVAQDIRMDLVTSDPTQPNQSLRFLGTFHVPNTGSLATYTDVELTDILGNPLPVEFSGVTTWRLTSISGGNDINHNFLMLLPTTAPTLPSVSTTPANGETGVLPNASVQAAIYDGSSPVNPASVVMTVNGSVVSPSVLRTNTMTLVKYTPGSFWAPLSSNYVNLAFSDGTPRSASWSFTVVYLPTLTPAMIATGTSTPGFVFRVFQNNDDDVPSTARAMEQLAGTSKDSGGNYYTNYADPTVTGQSLNNGMPDPSNPATMPLTYTIPTYVNMSQQNAYYGNIAPDDAMPGVPGTGGPQGGKDGIGADFDTFIQLPAGLVTLAFNSDDGFLLTAGFKDAPLVLADIEGQVDDRDYLIRLIVQQAGTYHFHMVWYQSIHGFGIEWTQVNADGSYTLINDTANGGYPAFQSGTAPNAPHPVLTIARAPGAQVTLTWGSTGTLQVASNVHGPYTSLLGVTSPYTTTVSGAAYYRVIVP